MTQDQIQTAIAAHGAIAVYDAASNHLANRNSLLAVGLAPDTLGDVWAVMGAAREGMTNIEVGQVNRATRRALAMISPAKHGLRYSLPIDSRTA